MRPKGLSKYDAPLRIQYQWGYDAFKRGGRFVTKNEKQIYQENRPNLDPNTSSTESGNVVGTMLTMRI